MADALILLDHFPAIATTPDGGKYEPARVVVYNGIVQVWVMRQGVPDPVVAYEREYLSVEGNRLAGFNILTSDGTVRSVRAGGCGCGSPLKRFDPYGGATRKVERLESKTF